jgi:hypothetical protein
MLSIPMEAFEELRRAKTNFCIVEKLLKPDNESAEEAARCIVQDGFPMSMYRFQRPQPAACPKKVRLRRKIDPDGSAGTGCGP